MTTSTAPRSRGGVEGCCGFGYAHEWPLPVIMSIIGPRETHDYRNYNLLGSGTIQSKIIIIKNGIQPIMSTCQ